jgi:hypothetical protein
MTADPEGPASQPSSLGVTRRMRTDNLDLVLSQLTAAECNAAADELARYLDAGLVTTRELMAAFLNDLNNESLTRWGPRGESGEAGDLPAPPRPADSQPSTPVIRGA